MKFSTHSNNCWGNGWSFIDSDLIIDCPLDDTDVFGSLELDGLCPVAEVEGPAGLLLLLLLLNEPNKFRPPLFALKSLFVAEPSKLLFEVKLGTAKDDTVGSEASALTRVWLREVSKVAGLVSFLSLVVDGAVAVADVVSFVRLIIGLTSFDVAGAGLVVAK